MEGQVAIELEARRRIYEHVVANPGTHLRAIQDALGMPMGQLEYHLRYLEHAAVLESKADRYYKRFYPREMGATDRRLIAALRQEMPRRIVLLLIQSPGVDHKTVQQRMGLGASTTSFYMRDLIDKEVVARRREGRRSLYWVVDVDRVVRILIAYRPSFLDRMVDRFLETWLSVGT
jgi:predicted transcriptional regulator